MSRRTEGRYWRSLTEHARNPDDVERTSDEFGPPAASPPTDTDIPSGVSRRRFLALVSASAAMGAAGCGRLDGRGEIVPYVDQPEGTPPGLPRFYASALPGTPGTPPVLVTVREGRPVKLEGNPEHPAGGGALGAFAQAAIFSLYDPDRIRTPSHNGAETTWQAADSAIRSALAQAVRDGKRILLFTPALASPTARRLVADFTAAYPTAKHLPVEIFHSGEATTGQAQTIGIGAPLQVNWDSTDVILSLEADFLGPWESSADQQGYAARRQPDGRMNRLWCVEGAMSVTGSNADHRLPLRPGLQGKFLLGLLHAVVVEHGLGPLAGRSDIARALQPFALGKTIGELGLDTRVVQALVRDLTDHRERGAVLAGAGLPAAAHALAAALNASLGNVGSTLVNAGGMISPVASATDLSSAVTEMASGTVAVVLNLGANPVYALPADLKLADALSRVPLVVSASLIADETAGAAHMVLPAAHDLETWGDTDCHAGALTLQQPAIQPLFEARQTEGSLLQWLPQQVSSPATYYDYLKARWQRDVYPKGQSASAFERFWTAALHDGFIPVSAETASTPAIRPEGVQAAIAAQGAVSPSGTDLVLAPSYHVYDGRYANNGWLQETPHPITSHVWGNGALMGPSAAAALGCKDGDAVSVSAGGRAVTLPAIVMPGVAEGVVQISLGHGRRSGGSIATGIGMDASVLRTVAGGLSPWIYTGVAIARADGRIPVVRTQEHHDIHGRRLVVEGDAAHYREHPDFVREIAPVDTSKSPGGWDYQTGQKWEMAIDLSLCTGCNACVVACMAENNVPVVGPDQVARGREMHWVRIDRYYSGSPDAPQTVRVVHQPMLCQHCDNAPCENVCPVAATAHSTDGLNEMTYNRCVGTRYCANNCPYKVRRFNFFNNHEDLASPQELRFNPEVTVRSRGVMEKCTFCVQRIRTAQQAARRDGRKLRDGDAVTACQQACPAGAVVFGDVNDPESRIHALSQNTRGYHVLGELGVRPSVTYLAKIRNPHPDLNA